jgi:hypothetical protein
MLDAGSLGVNQRCARAVVYGVHHLANAIKGSSVNWVKQRGPVAIKPVSSCPSGKQCPRRAEQVGQQISRMASTKKL